MTYDLNILVHQPTNARKVYDLVRRVIGIPESHETSTTFYEDCDRAIGWDESHPFFGHFDGRRYFRSTPGGFAAQLVVWYGGDGPLYHAEDPSYDPEHECTIECNGWAALKISLVSGGGTHDMLYYFADEIGTELGRMGLDWAWSDPQSGDTGTGADILGGTAERGREMHEGAQG